MSRARWLHNWFGWARSRDQRRRQAVPTRTPVRLMLETFEDRVTPSAADPSASLGPSPSPSPPPSASYAQMSIAVDVAEILLQGNPFGLAQLSNFSQSFLQKPLTPPSDLIAEIFVDLPYAGDMAISAVQLGISFAQLAASSPGGGGTKVLIL